MPDNDLNLLRDLITKLYAEGLVDSAVLLAEQVISHKDVNIKDYIQLANGYFHQGDHRRSLTLLEQYDLLSINQIEYIINIIANNTDLLITDISARLSAFTLAGKCLYQLSQYDDCISLLYPIVKYDEDVSINYTNDLLIASDLNLLSFISMIVGKSFDMIDNRTDSIKYLTLALKIDLSCVESVDYIITRNLLTHEEKADLYNQLDIINNKKNYLDIYYRSLLLIDNNSYEFNTIDTAISLSKKAEQYYEISQPEMAYIYSRQATNIDPFYKNGLIIYIASAVELNLKTELYYLGHELTKSSPKSAIAWYAVGCYYYCCKKYELAQKFLVKSTKLNKRLVYSWITLGHCLSAQEETEHAISAYRTAMRLAPGDYKPLYFMAREMVRSSNFTLAMHLLVTSSQKSPNNALILNEIGVIVLKLDRVQEAISYFESACNIITSSANESLNNQQINNKPTNYFTKSFSFEIYNNYGVALRKDGNYDKALLCFDIALSYHPNDADVHGNIAFTYHLARRFDEAIASYHNAVALKPQFTFAIEMLQKAMNDKYLFKDSTISYNDE